MKGADELHLELVFLFKLFPTFTFSCLFAPRLCGFLRYPAACDVWGLLLRKLQQAALQKQSVTTLKTRNPERHTEVTRGKLRTGDLLVCVSDGAFVPSP